MKTMNYFGFIRRMFLTFMMLGVFTSAALCAANVSKPKRDKCPPDIGKFRIGMQAYTFRGNTFEEAVEKTAMLGLTYIEGYPGQRIRAASPDIGAIGPDMSAEARSAVKAMLSTHGVKLHNFGVVGLPNNEAESRKVFDFAKDMGIEIIVSEPAPDAFPLVDKLVREYNIKVAIHNHPKPSHYNDPNTVLEAIKGLDKRIGASPDIGHWMRSGFDPITSLKLLKGRVLSMHIKDVDKMNDRGAVDAPFGKGATDLPAIFKELEKQRFDGVISIEYEGSQPDPTKPVEESVKYLRKLLTK